MNYILLLCSLVFDTLKNAYTNHFGKNLQETQADTYVFNAGISGGAMLFCLLFAFFVPFSISSFSFVMAVFYAITTACAQYFMVMSMALGPMSYSILFTYLGGIIVPTAYATILAGQTVTVFQVVGLLCMGVSVLMGLDLKKDKAITKKWLFFSVGSFVMWGLVGICQVIHQSSAYRKELLPFLFWAFVLMTLSFSVLGFACRKKDTQTTDVKFNRRILLCILLVGIATGAINLINVYLSGAMPSVIFFPIVNGGVILLSEITAIFGFKEKLSRKQFVSIIAGIVAVCLLSM